MRSWIGRLLATTLLAGTAAVAGPAYAASDPDDAEPTACQQVWDAFPAALQDDIKAAGDLPLRERRRAFHAIRYAALHGGYGGEVQAWAERVRERRIELWKEFPDQLKADVRAAWSLPLREQRRAMLAIRYAALHGEYGDRVQESSQRSDASSGRAAPAAPPGPSSASATSQSTDGWWFRGSGLDGLRTSTTDRGLRCEERQRRASNP